MCGNSLGLQPKTTSAVVNGELDKWARVGVKGHFEGDIPWATCEELLPKLAKVTPAATDARLKSPRPFLGKVTSIECCEHPEGNVPMTARAGPCFCSNSVVYFHAALQIIVHTSAHPPASSAARSHSYACALTHTRVSVHDNRISWVPMTPTSRLRSRTR